MDFELLKMFCLGDMALFARHDDRRFGSFSIKNTSVILDTVINGIAYEPLARSGNYLK